MKNTTTLIYCADMLGALLLIIYRCIIRKIRRHMHLNSLTRYHQGLASGFELKQFRKRLTSWRAVHTQNSIKLCHDTMTRTLEWSLYSTMTLESQSSRVTYHYQRQIVFRPNDRVSLAKRNDKQYDLTLPTGAHFNLLWNCHTIILKLIELNYCTYNYI